CRPGGSGPRACRAERRRDRPAGRRAARSLVWRPGGLPARLNRARATRSWRTGPQGVPTPCDRVAAPCYHRPAMTLTELKYIVAVARERHFGRTAEACFVSQPTLSVAIKKLEEELGVQLFERGGTEVSVTPIGMQIVEQAQRVLEQTHSIREIAAQGKDPLAGPLRVGVIYTIGPY